MIADDTVTIAPNGMIYLARSANRFYDRADAAELAVAILQRVEELERRDEQAAAAALAGDEPRPTGADQDRSGQDAYRHGEPVPLDRPKRRAR